MATKIIPMMCNVLISVCIAATEGWMMRVGCGGWVQFMLCVFKIVLLIASTAIFNLQKSSEGSSRGRGWVLIHGVYGFSSIVCAIGEFALVVLRPPLLKPMQPYPFSLATFILASNMFEFLLFCNCNCNHNPNPPNKSIDEIDTDDDEEDESINPFAPRS